MNTQERSIYGLSNAERVANGLAWLREHSATLDLHTSRIDPDRIELYEPFTCVLAQASGRGYGATVRDAMDAGLVNTGYQVAIEWARDHAFFPAVGENVAAVRAEWVRVLSTSEPF